MNKNVTYIILNEQQSNSSISSLLNVTPVVSQVIFERTNPHILGGENIANEQIRDFRANRLENNEHIQTVAYTTNIPESPSIDEGQSLNFILRQSISQYSQNQLNELHNLGISQDDINEGVLINTVVETAIEGLIDATTSDINYANQIHNFISRANSSIRDLQIPDTNHLFFFRPENNFSSNFDRQIFSTLINVSGGALSFRILNIFLALGLNFMDFVYSRYIELSTTFSTDTALWMNIPTQLFFVRLRQALTSIFILFLGLDHIVSIDLNTFLLALRSATLSIGLIINISRSYELLTQSNISNINILNANARLEEITLQSNSSIWSNLRIYYNFYLRPIFNVLRINPIASLGTSASLIYIYQILLRSGLLRNFFFYAPRTLFNSTQFGPITNLFNQLFLAFAEFLRRFRHF